MGQGLASKAPLAGLERRLLKRFALAASLAPLALATSASPAAASVTIGELAPPSSPVTCTGVNIDAVQQAVTTGSSYVVPATNGIVSWRVTSWSTNARPGSGQRFKMKIWRQISGLTYMAVGHDGPRDLTGGALNTFTGISVPAKAGDLLGLNVGPVSNACSFSSPGGQPLARAPSDLPDGQQGDFFSSPPNQRLNISAIVAPTNTFSLGEVNRNKKKGTATLTVNVPNPGELTGSGNGVNAAGAAAISKTVAPGTTQLLIRAKKKKKKKLKRKGKVELNVAVTYTPTGGDSSTQSLELKLKKKLRKR